MHRLSFPAPHALTPALESELSEMLSKIYRASRAAAHGVVGAPYMSWICDLRAHAFHVRATPEALPEKLARFVYLAHMDERRQAVGSQFQFDFADRSETHFVRGQVNFTGLQLYISGNDFERIFPSTTAPVPKAEWDLWGTGLSAEISRRYETVIHPKVVETLTKILELRGGRPMFVADLGGGSGGLASALCEQVAGVRTIVVLEQSATLVEQARRRAREHEGRFLVKRGDLTTDAAFDLLGEAPDVVILSGVVAQQVLERDDGLRVMRACFQRIAAGGFVLVPSYSPALLTSRDYESIGFAVHNKTLQTIEERALRTHDFYILEKT
jgi:hypothetical protein